MRRWRRDDRGSIMPMVPFIIIALLLLGGLVVDGGRELNARSQAQAYAEEAARAGATAVDLTSTNLKLLPGEANQRVMDFCANIRAQNPDINACTPSGISGVDVTCGAATITERIVVHATVTMAFPPTLLGMVPGVNELHATGKAKARPYEGVTTPDSC